MDSSGLICESCGAKDSSQKKRYVAKPTVVTSDFIAEEVWNGAGTPRFLVYHFDSSTFEEVEEIDLGEEDGKSRHIIYVPVDNDALRKGLVIVPRRAARRWKVSPTVASEARSERGLNAHSP